MKTYIYQDEKSHKFWAVEQQENELHISWGKVGTNGQNQVKSFADAAAAEKAKLKLIAEKTKKGYVEIFHTALLHRYVVKFHSVIRMGETI